MKTRSEYDIFTTKALLISIDRYYSAIKPAPNKDIDTRLPHITIELPVYKESLKETM